MSRPNLFAGKNDHFAIGFEYYPQHHYFCFSILLWYVGIGWSKVPK